MANARQRRYEKRLIQHLIEHRDIKVKMFAQNFRERLKYAFFPIGNQPTIDVTGKCCMKHIDKITIAKE